MTRHQLHRYGPDADTRADPARAKGRRLVVTERARDALARLCHDRGRQALLLRWPGGAATLPLTLYSPGRFDVIIGHVASCPIYADVRQLGSSVVWSAVLDVDRSVWHPEWPLLRLDLAADEPAPTPMVVA